MNNIVISKPAALENFLAEAAGKPDSLFVVADFDHTVTKERIEGQPGSTLFSLLLAGGIFPAQYDEDAKTLYKGYKKTLEQPGITEIETYDAARQWFEDKLELIVRYGIQKQDVEQAITSPRVAFRDDTFALFSLLKQHDIPLVFISATSLGISGIRALLQRYNQLLENMHIVSNDMVWDANGRGIDYVRPVIHTYNKNEIALGNYPALSAAVSGRNNIILLGDSIGDERMSDSFQHNNVLKIGFVNNPQDPRMAIYKEKFDMLILDDGPLQPVCDLLEQLIH